MIDIRDRSSHEKLLEWRVIVLDRDIDETFCNEIIAKLLFLQQEDETSPIHLLVDSPGGGVGEGFAVIDVMDHVTAPVHTYCYGRADAFAAIIVAHGELKHRYATSTAEFTLSNPWSPQVDVSKSELSRITSKLVDTVSSATGNSERVVQRDFDANRYFNAIEARAYNLVDQVVETYPDCNLGI